MKKKKKKLADVLVPIIIKSSYRATDVELSKNDTEENGTFMGQITADWLPFPNGKNTC